MFMYFSEKPSLVWAWKPEVSKILPTFPGEMPERTHPFSNRIFQICLLFHHFFTQASIHSCNKCRMNISPGSVSLQILKYEVTPRAGHLHRILMWSIQSYDFWNVSDLGLNTEKLVWLILMIYLNSRYPGFHHFRVPSVFEKLLMRCFGWLFVLSPWSSLCKLALRNISIEISKHRTDAIAKYGS